MKRNVVLGCKLHELLDGHLTEFGGPSQRDLVLPVELQGQQPGRFRRQVARIQSRRRDKFRWDLNTNLLHSVKLTDHSPWCNSDSKSRKSLDDRARATRSKMR